jgi:RNA polymerase sigma factor (sigma-70 family)
MEREVTPAITRFVAARQACTCAKTDRARRRADGAWRTALAELVEEHRSLVERVARTYAPQAGSLDLDDLTQEGMLGFLRAVAKFDPSRDTKLSTWAVPWISGACMRAINDRGRMVRVPRREKSKPSICDTTELDEGREVWPGASPEDELIQRRRQRMSDYVKSILDQHSVEGWVIVLEIGHALLGMPERKGERVVALSPVYFFEGTVIAEGDPRNPAAVHVQQLHRCSPILGLASLNYLPIREGSPVIPVSQLSKSEQDRLRFAVERCNDVKKCVTAAQAGIQAPPPGAMGLRHG